MSVFNDLRQFKNPRARRPRSTARFPYGTIPKNAKGSVILDPGSFDADAVGAERAPGRRTSRRTRRTR